MAQCGLAGPILYTRLIYKIVIISRISLYYYLFIIITIYILKSVSCLYNLLSKRRLFT